MVMRTVSPARSASRGTPSSPRTSRESWLTVKATGDSASCSTTAINPALAPTSVPSTVTGMAATAESISGVNTVTPVADASLQRTVSAEARSAVTMMAASVRAEPKSRDDQDGSGRCKYITNPFHKEAECPRLPDATCGANARNSTAAPCPGRRAGDRPVDAGDRDEFPVARRVLSVRERWPRGPSQRGDVCGVRILRGED